MKIAVDGYYLGPKMRGMARYADMLLKSLPPEVRVALPLAHDFTTNRDVKWFPLWEQFGLPRDARRAQADYLLCPYNTGPLLLSSPPVIVVIHDLIFLDDELSGSPSKVQILGRQYRKAVARRIAEKSCHVITCSQFSKREIVREFGLSADKITVIPNIVAEEWFQHKPDPDLEQPYILAVAGEGPSKNAARLLEAMAILHTQKPALSLQLAGVKPQFHENFATRARELGIGDRVHFVPYLGDAELRALYRRASAFVCPSLAEGFGIPLLEAMAAGIPISSSHATSLPEVGGDCAVYFDPYDPEAMAAAIEASLDRPERVERAAAGRERARRFTLRAIQPQLLAFWDSFDPERDNFAAARVDCA
jgi:glycosyltransferase involved in cell wall biosynthesis